MFKLVCFVNDIVPYQESTTLQLSRTAAAVGNTIYVRSQMTDSRQHAESTNATTLPHRRQHHLCARGVSSLCCGELLVSKPVICPSTIPHVSSVLPLWVRVSIDRCGNIGNFKNSNNLDTNQPILAHSRPQREALFNESLFFFFVAKIADDRQQQTTCEE